MPPVTGNGVKLGGVGGETLHFLRLRNPWGTFSWEGAWSDGSKLWQEHSGVASALSFRDAGTKDDGAFWMVIEDFVKFFDAVDVCDREVRPALQRCSIAPKPLYR